ncbi:hypothetical protein C4E15_06685 [Achromobacter spanius]|uniref:Uncharacterized protein n=1 Tax=Achromobacter spanius TaxID=217203 RepID=A0A2S5GTR6_9BURK|nr:MULTISPECIES: hypothetical protein [Achromobacter]PPA76477.1 hypothetical protein C4E15_06685 [Achromobacter spanius]
MIEHLHTLEWSQRQGMFHIQPLSSALEKNQASFACNAKTDYIPVHVGTRAQCEEAANLLRPILKRREGIEA